MQNKNPFSPKDVNRMLEAACSRLGVSPLTLRRQLERGDLSSLNASLTPQQKQMMNDILSDPKKMQKMAASTDLNTLLRNIK